MRQQFSFTVMGIFVLVLLCFDCTNAQGITLVDFGASQVTTTFGLTGWNTILKSSNINHTSLGNGGLVIAAESGEYDEYRGISGLSRKFSIGERIVVTWYNNSDEAFYFTSRISFTDRDEPNPDSPDGNWYTMRSFNDYRVTYSEISPHSTVKTVFNITDIGVHKTDESYSLVNINLAIEWGSTYQKQFLICEKIELLSDADIIPPSQPRGLSANALSDSKVQLVWNQPSDNIEVVEYLVYMNGAIEGYSRTNDYTCVLLEANTEYVFSITALDAAGNESIKSDSIYTTTHSFKGSDRLINPSGFEYLGAIALPEDFSWGGEAIAYHSDGGETGTLFVTNVNQPENGFVGEVNIPSPVISSQKKIDDLNIAVTLKEPVNIRPSNVNNWEYVDIWRTGLEYIPDERRLYSSWSIHYTVTEEKHASISCCDTDNLSGSTKYGAWYVGHANAPPIDAMMSDWLFSTPQSWADAHCAGRNIVVGRCRDGGLSGLGPTMYAFSKVGDTPPSANSELEFTTLLEYGPVAGTDNYTYPNAMDGYTHSDDWREAVWLTAGKQNAVAVVGKKGLGHNWYGYYGEWMHHDWVIADVPNPEPEFWVTDPTGKGWRSHNWQPMIIFYNPVDLANAGSGLMNTFEPQPYAALRISSDVLFSSHAEIFSAAFNFQTGLLYVAEMVAESDGRVILHVWKIESVATSIGSGNISLSDITLSQNYPNPFNSETVFQYQLHSMCNVSLIIYSSTGHEIRMLEKGQKYPGLYQMKWDGKDSKGNHVSSGIYFLCLRTEEFVQTKKLLYLK